ncbi:S8 family peptidase [Nonomuraea zeae]|uniref:Serine protease n=1 Tax=Nonomuraea zeae TaxID=1642303 RepID=A0A5S4GEM9_9ACTN|nr:S8 family serine peptidase [Nonomuraea zeae]TMR31222.1 serine protease [Nonomuraea zeae]
MSRLRRGSAALTSAFALVAGTLAQPVAAQAQQEPPAKSEAAQPFALEGLGKGPHSITLITGDKVKLTDAGGGRFAVRSEGSVRPDGRVASLFVQSSPKGVYALPDDALSAVQAGRLDRELFNVKYLAENGYTDELTKQLPVIVQYPEGEAAAKVKSAAGAIPASAPTTTLESINAAALDVTKAEAGAFWAAVRAEDASARSALRGGISKVWLDRKVKADLAESVPMIGAPHAWAAGHDGAGVKVAVLDTGVDAGHPDLAGKIADSRSFIPGEEVRDGHGHGTHVASTIAGSGAASGGRNKGVAPGAQLLVGKVLSNTGSGDESGIIEAMEWATAGGAKVVSMSLGANATDGTDPMSQAVNDLTASTGALFVIAAGNVGTPESVSTPGTADAALTVAAVDKSDGRASFSSMGPRLDGALKPDIAAPGVDIAAARAAGTVMGTPVDDRYTKASGTSMATPHVAGAAAIMAQVHPDWTAGQLKSALMSTAKDVGEHVYQQGAGRLDLARAHDAQVFSSTANIDFGRLDDTGKPQTREIGYTNLGDQPVTLTLKAVLAASGGDALADRLSTADTTLTVPAKGTAATTVTLVTEGLALGTYSGAVTAQAGDVSLTTPVGVVREAPTFELTIRTLDRDGKPRSPWAMDVIDVEGNKGLMPGPHWITEEGTVVTRVPSGTISLLQVMDWVDGDSRANRAWLFEPELAITGDTEITLDARRTTQVRFDTPQPAEPLNNTYTAQYQRTVANGKVYAAGLEQPVPIGTWGKLWVTPTKKVTKGAFRFSTFWTLGQSEIAMSVRRPDKLKLNPAANVHWFGEVNHHPEWTPFKGTQDLQVVDVGLGTPEEIAGRDLRGKLVLMAAEHAQDMLGNPICGAQIERIGPVRDAGAAGIAIFPVEGSGCPVPLGIAQKPFSGPEKPIGIALAHLSSKEGMALRKQLTRDQVTIRVTGTPETPYMYVFTPYYEGRIPDSLHVSLRKRDLAQVDMDVHSAGPKSLHDFRYVYKQDDAVRWSTSPADADTSIVAPKSRTDWVWPTDRTIVHNRGIEALGQPEYSRYRVDVYERPGRVRQQWRATPSTPGAATVPDAVTALADPDGGVLEQQGLGVYCAICVQGDQLWTDFSVVAGVGENRDDSTAFWSLTEPFTPAYEQHLYRDGTELPVVGGDPFPKTPRYTLPSATGTYRLTAKNADNDVEWTFTAPAGDAQGQRGIYCNSWFLQGYGEHCKPVPAVFVSYDLGSSLAMDNTVAAGRGHTFQVEPYHSPSATRMPKIAGLKLWSSTDDGATWQPVTLKRGADGVYTASTRYPAMKDTKGTVSLKAEAWDASGNRLKMTNLRAFALRAR